MAATAQPEISPASPVQDEEEHADEPEKEEGEDEEGEEDEDGEDKPKKKGAAVEQIVPAVELDDISDDEKTKMKKFKRETIDVLKLVGTNFALILIVALYCGLGGFIFNSLEAPNEIAGCKDARALYKEALAKAVKQIDFLSSNLQLSDAERSDYYSQAMDQLRIDFQGSGWDMRDCDTMTPKWSWMGAFFFCLTVVSTIGYGHIAPATSWGRIIVMFYAIVGLPLMVMALASVGSVLASMFKWLYNMVCCCGCCIKHRKARVRIKPPAIMWRVSSDGKPVGDGPSVLAEDTDSDLEDEGEVNIPLTVSLVVIALSLVIGAVIFSAYEDWSFLDAAYFSFVSLSTIGFGDLVPEFSDASSLKSQGKMLVTWLFLVFGMALVSMCLQMMQDEVAEKVKWLSAKFKMEKEQRMLQKQQQEAEAKAQKKAEIEEAGQFGEETEHDLDADDEDEEPAPLTQTLQRVKSGLRQGSAFARSMITQAELEERAEAIARPTTTALNMMRPRSNRVAASSYGPR